ncbi:lysylphosphatidylglycerol synthase domain-containing protein [Stappia sp. WLB 29]|uniref:lysylphosphatidylglycerol synthase domain-containing protein n=1 Tax=Stappia sp. WLB 29 TaxID=2925220 RepID=UPI0020C0CCF4|nr:lysylphosphatidylglycerol synthase domain-containing protein [Stappia sp. WLB 29]
MSFYKLLLRLVIVVAIGIATYLLYRTLSQYSLDEILESVRTIPATYLARAFAFAAASYLCLTFFDWLAVRYAGKPLAWHRTALASFTALSIGHNVGVAALSSGAIRYRFYARWGLGVGDVAKVILFCGITVGLGLATMGGIALLLYPSTAEGLMGVDGPELKGMAIVCLSLPVAYVVLSAVMRRELTLHKWSVKLPPLPLALGQVAAGTANYACVAACLHQLLAATSEVNYLEVAAIYVIGILASLISHVPGGLGVLEATVLYLQPGAEAVGALLVFRLVYFLVPLALGLPTLLASEYFLRPAGKRQQRAKTPSGATSAADGRP